VQEHFLNEISDKVDEFIGSEEVIYQIYEEFEKQKLSEIQ
jgi:hypothetical protein